MTNKKRLLLQNVFLISFFIFTSAIYLNNITRDIYSGDIGDLVTAANVFGVPHPPGYPLFTFSGFILSHLPLTIPPVSKVALISIISSIAALIFFYKFCKRETKSFFISLLSTSILAFSYMFWFFAEIPEVFALNNFFITALFYFAIRFYETKQKKFLYISSFIVGLSLTNQHQIILLFPSLFLFFLPSLKKLIKEFRIIINSVIFLLLGLAPYIYIPIAASRNPVVNWDNPSNIQNFLHLVLRQDYVTFTKGVLTISERLPMLDFYFSSLLNNYSILIVLLCIGGILYLVKNNKLKFINIISAVLVSGLIFIFYIVPPIVDADSLGVIERFYMESFVVFLFFLPYGFLFVRDFTKRLVPKKIEPTIFLMVFLIVPAQMIFYNFEKNNLSKTNIGNNLGFDLLSALPKNSIILLHADSNTFNSWYVHFALGFRPDVTIVNNKGAGNDYFQKRLYEGFLEKNPDSKLTHEDALRIKLPQIIKDQHFFSTFFFETYDRNLFFIPRGIYYEVIDRSEIPQKDEYVASVNRNIEKLRIPRRDALLPSEQNLITPSITRTYSFGLTSVGTILNDYYQDPNLAIGYFRQAVKTDNSYSTAYVKLGVLNLSLESDCKSSIENIKKGIKLNPINRRFYSILMMVYSKCGISGEETDSLKSEYQRLFKTGFEDLPSIPSKIPLQ